MQVNYLYHPPKKVALCFNPCFGGLPFAIREGFRLELEEYTIVSILVLVDSLLQRRIWVRLYPNVEMFQSLFWWTPFCNLPHKIWGLPLVQTVFQSLFWWTPFCNSEKSLRLFATNYSVSILVLVDSLLQTADMAKLRELILLELFQSLFWWTPFCNDFTDIADSAA